MCVPTAREKNAVCVLTRLNLSAKGAGDEPLRWLFDVNAECRRVCFFFIWKRISATRREKNKIDFIQVSNLRIKLKF